jgi:hypothetical protein
MAATGSEDRDRRGEVEVKGLERRAVLYDQLAYFEARTNDALKKGNDVAVVHWGIKYHRAKARLEKM